MKGETDTNKIYNYVEINSVMKLKELKGHYSEAKLVQILEEKGIGRPSTFSSLIDKIQTRKYVLKQDVKGKKINCIDFKLKGNELEEREKEKEFGAEKNKLVLQPLGAIVIEFLIKHFCELFEYDYTKKMEDELDIIEKGDKIWYTLCKECNDMMDELGSKIKNKKKKIFRIDENHVYMIGRYGPVIKYEKDGETKFKNVKKNLDIANSNIKSFKQLIKTPKKSVIARSEKQSEYIKALKENDIVMSLGPAGTGKSFLAVSVAVTLLMEKKIDRVILSRPAVEAGEKLGFLPGDMKEKVDPYLRPLYDALYELFGADKIDKKIETGEIEIAPLAFMRGRTLKNCFAILDEAQNATETQIKMFLTRIGENSKLVVNGDPSQVDLINKSYSGLIKSRNILKDLKEIKIIEFDHTDVVRHPLVSKIIRAYQKKSTDDKN